MRKDTLLGAFSGMFMLQRWNFLPRVESWVEAENITYTTHLAYALACEAKGFPAELLPHLVARSLLKSFTKHFLSDVSHRTRTALAEVTGDPDAWGKMVAEHDGRAAKLFPRKIAPRVRGYLSRTAPCAPAQWELIDRVIKYAQLRAAQDECAKNDIIYHEYYGPYVDHFAAEIADLAARDPLFGELDLVFRHLTLEPLEGHFDSRFPHYFAVIRCLKDLRRWNQVNRSVETSVLGHTFVVATLAWTYAWMHEQAILREAGAGPAADGAAGECGGGEAVVESFATRAALKALFHDVPEGMTGDVISPVKETITRQWGWETWQQVEKRLGEDTIVRLLGGAARLRADLDQNGYLREEEDPAAYTVASLVRACDRLALVVECVIEHEAGGLRGEMAGAYAHAMSELQRSEWRHIREQVAVIAAELRPA
jgi:putative hydrolase of HD superfamily